MYRVSGVSMDTIKMMVFPISLEEVAAHWENEVSTRLVQNWDMVKGEFLKAFFSKENTLEMRKKIHSFKQGHDESLCRAWDRLSQLIRDCPHHGLSRSTIIGRFYDGCHRNSNDMMDVSSGGSLSAVSVGEEEAIITRIASNWRGHTFEEEKKENASRVPIVPAGESKPFTNPELKHETDQGEKGESHAEVYKVGLNKNYSQKVENDRFSIKQCSKSNNKPEMKSTKQRDDENLSFHLGEIRGMVLNLKESHEGSSARPMDKLGKMETRLNEKVDALDEMNALFRSHVGFLSHWGEKISASREYVWAVTLRRGKELPGRPPRVIPITTSVSDEVAIEKYEMNSPHAEDNDDDMRTKAPRPRSVVRTIHSTAHPGDPVRPIVLQLIHLIVRAVDDPSSLSVGRPSPTVNPNIRSTDDPTSQPDGRPSPFPMHPVMPSILSLTHPIIHAFDDPLIQSVGRPSPNFHPIVRPTDDPTILPFIRRSSIPTMIRSFSHSDDRVRSNLIHPSIQPSSTGIIRIVRQT